MAPRSWRPDSSLGEAVPLNEVKVDAVDSETNLSYTVETTYSYSYSGQIEGQPVDINTTPINSSR